MILLLGLPAGLLIGMSLGALGAGGSILTVPALVYLLGQTPHQATSASLLVVGAAALAGVGAHWRAGRVRLGPGLVFGAVGAAGSVLGSKASALADPNVLLLGFAGLMVAAGVGMLARGRNRQHEPDEDGAGGGGGVATKRRVDTARAVKVLVAATVVGLLTGFFGVGGGFVVVPALVLALGYDTATAVGTSLVVIVINSAVALATRVAGHGVSFDWPLLGVFLVAAVAGVLLGNRIASRVAPQKLTTAFAVMLLVVAFYTAVRSALQL
ncbi:sulfite exporter TauE/SafE family protein [Amycolatopsis alkalitolerans]|uniref:Probable membrane transporter protein n=1 Tax=Amycolatopsis alkalitolerans TaxID=2547244 RepID=A0A5C4M946_9PSEU|nr:sulfite exporter TauE/SafE family protein [Amycolatopsis alkalitolerans]TNC29656.1 sulfite exporter TauE/SafE family protein [Amycolatopsis alkalitolerans]